MRYWSSRPTGQWSANEHLLPALLPIPLAETLKMPSQKTQKRTSDALALVEGLAGKSQEMADLLAVEQANLDIARKICELRTKAKLSQAELARWSLDILEDQS